MIPTCKIIFESLSGQKSLDPTEMSVFFHWFSFFFFPSGGLKRGKLCVHQKNLLNGFYFRFLQWKQKLGNSSVHLGSGPPESQSEAISSPPTPALRALLRTRDTGLVPPLLLSLRRVISPVVHQRRGMLEEKKGPSASPLPFPMPLAGLTVKSLKSLLDGGHCPWAHGRILP